MAPSRIRYGCEKTPPENLISLNIHTTHLVASVYHADADLLAGHKDRGDMATNEGEDELYAVTSV
jgi:hypothetical protein